MNYKTKHKHFQEDDASLSNKPIFYNLKNYEDRQKIEEFEEEFKPYEGKTCEVYGKRLYGIDIYLHDNNLLVYSEYYPEGAVVEQNLTKYRVAIAKYEALKAMVRGKKPKEEQASDRLQALNNLRRELLKSKIIK